MKLEEPCEGRLSNTVLRERISEIPPRDPIVRHFEKNFITSNKTLIIHLNQKTLIQMTTVKTTNGVIDNRVSLAKASLIAGFGLLIMVLTVPFAEFYIFPKVIGQNSTETAGNILNNKLLFTTGIFLHLITLLCDIIVAWALYIFLKPVHKDLSLLTAWFRLIYTAMYIIALVNLIKVLNLINIENQGEPTNKLEFSNSIEFYISSFQLEWQFGLLIFGIYLCLLGYLVFRAEYIPKIFGILLLVAGFGYVINTLSLFLIPSANTEFLMITFFGELVFMFWLLIKGSKIRGLEIQSE